MKKNLKNTKEEIKNEIIDIRGIRRQLGMAREEFAKTFHFSTRSIENWEEGCRKPNNHTVAYLKLINFNSTYVQDVLNNKTE